MWFVILDWAAENGVEGIEVKSICSLFLFMVYCKSLMTKSLFAFVQALDGTKKAGYPKDSAKRLEKEVSGLEQNLQISAFFVSLFHLLLTWGFRIC